MTEKILTKNQIEILKKIGKNKFLTENFYLTGGTVLAAFYLNHRLSEDLDFFSEHEFDLLSLDIFFTQIRKDLKISKIDYQSSYNRNLFFLHFPDEILKIEFTFFPFRKIDKGIEKYGIEIDSILDIAVNKLFTIYQRTKARDYIDLYFICQKQNLKIKNLIKLAKAKFDWHIDPIQLGTQFLKAEEASDLPRMIKKISAQKWQDFFLNEAAKLKEDVVG